MKDIKVEVRCCVPRTAKLKGFIFETKDNFILNLHKEIENGKH